MNRRRTLALAGTVGTSLVVLSCAGIGPSKKNFAERVKRDFEQKAGRPIDLTLSPEAAISLMTTFAESVRYQTEASSPYSDSLLFEYGVFDWGRGENFDLKISRQVIFAGSSTIDADEHIVQISVTHRYQPEPFRKFPIITQWGSLLPPGMSVIKFAESTPGYHAAKRQVAKEVTLYSVTQ